MNTRIRVWYGGLPDPVKAGLATFFFAFWGIFGLALTGWLTDLASWVADSDNSAFPDAAVLSKAFFAALTAGILGVVNTIGRTIQRAVTAIPGQGPVYPEVDQPKLVEAT